ncbi:hypothetical protein SEUBUCD646_0K01720 [Saccharomyces eubayanus]|uniref:Uncharacterized protein n=1 Tax=Saccharomyces eubayanus TaxID=1080349 RepID=A0ABN8VD79_SACEU|nr:hypothetical protein SEUBUCD650_0K01710 [Saccharomyces eubayanus]CAI1567520.1 hypothetical protein SEUBUCD646_0K01720 [Saccharomyces eubayanus]
MNSYQNAYFLETSEVTGRLCLTGIERVRQGKRNHFRYV